MTLQIVTKRKRWTKKAQRWLPGHVLRWMYGQLRDFGPNGDWRYPEDVGNVPTLLKEGGSPRPAHQLNPPGAERTYAPTKRQEHSKPKPARNNQESGKASSTEEVFVPLDAIPEMTAAERHFLNVECEIHLGLYDSVNKEFVVKRGASVFRGRGSRGSGWRRIKL